MRTLLARTGLVLLAASAAVAAGCAEERDPIDRTQPGALPKSFFLGADLKSPADDPEFRMKSFVVGGAVGQTEYGIGEFSSVDRIRWEISEGMLLGRRSYQEAPGSDDRAEGAPDGQSARVFTKPADGTVVAAFRIDRHFDVRREYNAQTGEEANVVVENDSDRPWTEREYIRVDWSKNLVDSTNDRSRFWKSARVTPVEYSVTDPAAEDAPRFEKDAGYLDVTNKFTVEQEEVAFSWGTLKRCVLVSFLTGTSTTDCNPTEATVRTSFARVSPEEDFERFEDNRAWQDIVGNTGGEGHGFDSGLGSVRTTWDPQYGYNDAQTHRLKSIHNLWKKSHQAATCGSNVDADGNGTADACEKAVTGHGGHGGSQCDVAVGRCTIPVRDRELRTIAYHLNPQAPETFQDKLDGAGKVTERGTLEQLGVAWSQLLDVAVAYRREVECRRTKEGDRDACHAEFFESDASPAGKQAVAVGGWLTDKAKPQAVDQGKPGFYVCHNPVRAYDPESVCGKPGERARMGDIRKNHLIYWPYESRAGYGGVGWNPPAPLTGETFGATATIMGRSATRAAAQQRDVIQLALGDTSMDEIVAGVPADRYARMMKDGASAPEGFRVAKTSAELAARVEQIDRTQLRSTIAVKSHDGATELQRIAIDTNAKAKSLVDGAQFTAGLVQFDRSAAKLRGIPGLTEDMLTPLGGVDTARADAMRSWYQQDMAARGACFHDQASAGGTGSLYLASLAGFFRERYGSLSPKERGERIYDDLVKETIKGIGLHEIGHSIGMRHNFASSWDAPNFGPQYWQLRTADGKATGKCSGPRTGDADTCMGPRYLDPMTTDEQGLAGESRPGIDYFGNTSIMEYAIERGGESVGLGTYDQHAMKSLYGRVLETFDDRDMPLSEQPRFALKNLSQLQERDFVLHGNAYRAHYTTTAREAKVFDDARDCRPATDQEKAENAWRVVHGKVCAPPPKDHWAWEDFQTGKAEVADIELVKWHAVDVDAKDRVRWNYRYGEQYGAGGYMHTVMQDAGADIYELTQNLTRSFELRYPWQYFRRGDREWIDEFIPRSVTATYFSRLRAYHWQIALDLARSSTSKTALTDDDDERPSAMAQADIFAFLQRAALTPEPGDYASQPALGGGTGRPIFDLVAGSEDRSAFTLGIGDARFIAIDFENEKGGSWGYQKFVHHAGFEAEKAMALMQLVDPRPTLFTVARENYLDGRGVMISFRNDLPDGVDRLLGGILGEDWESISPHVMGDAQAGLASLDLAAKSLVRPQGARLVFPNVGYKQQLAMAVYAAIFSRMSSDTTLLNKLRLWVDGDRAPTIPGTREVRFADPATGFTWIASKYGDDMVDGKAVDHGVASRMLGRANELLASAYQTKKDPVTGKPMVDDKGQVQLVLDAGGKPTPTTPEAALALRRYVGLLDGLRTASRALDGVPLPGAPGGSDDD